MDTVEILKNAKGGVYEKAFWNSMRTRGADDSALKGGHVFGSKGVLLPTCYNETLEKQRTQNSTFRKLATVLKHYSGSVDFLSAENEDYADFLPENGEVQGFGVGDDFTRIKVQLFKAVVLVKVPMELTYDASFNLEDYLLKRMAKSFARAENKAFINGTGEYEPIGILHPTEGAEKAAEVDELTYDSVIDLFFSVKREYRDNAVWMMNDTTALALRKLKDAEGNYLWNQASDTILGKSVVICNEMLEAESGKMPVVFGDFSYYWIVDRVPVSMKPLHELFATNDQVGYLGKEFLDARLIRRDAIKGISIK